MKNNNFNLKKDGTLTKLSSNSPSFLTAHEMFQALAIGELLIDPDGTRHRITEKMYIPDGENFDIGILTNIEN